MVKSRLSQALFVIACDQALALTASDDVEIAYLYLEQCSPEKYDVVSRVKRIFTSFSHTHLFLKDYQVTEVM